MLYNGIKYSTRDPIIDVINYCVCRCDKIWINVGEMVYMIKS